MDPLLDPSLDFDTQAQQLIQQQARIKALRGIAAAPVEAPAMSPGWSSAVTGTHIGGQTLKTPTAALLQPIAAQLGADYQQDRTNAAQTDLNTRERDDLADILKNVPQAKQVPLGPDEPTGNFTGDPSKAIALMTDPVERARAQQAWINQQNGNMKTVQPTQAEMLGAVGRMSNNPLARAMQAKLLEETMFTRPDKLEERTYQSGEKAKDRGSVLTAALAKAQADSADKAAQRAQSETNTRIMAGARQAATDTTAAGTFVPVAGLQSSNGLPVERNTRSGETREIQPPPGTSFQQPVKPPKELTDAAKKEQDALLTGSRTYSQAFANYKDSYSGGLGTAKIASTLGQYTPIGEETASFWSPVKKQQAIANHQLYGASFTGPEQARADSYNPSEYKSREQNLAGMGQMAIDNGLAQLRSTYVHNNPGSYVDNDGSVVLQNGQVIKDTASRLITNGEIKTQKLNPIPTYRDVAAANPRAGAPGRPSAGGASGSWDATKTNEPNLPIIRSQAERDALPPGTTYIDGQGIPATTPARK